MTLRNNSIQQQVTMQALTSQLLVLFYRAGNNALSGTGLTVDSLSDGSQALLDIYNTLVASNPTAASLARDAGAYSPLCLPGCLNFGSFAPLLGLQSSCVCGSSTLNKLRSIATNGARVAAVAMAGAAAMYVACTWLLMILTGHSVMASYDRSTARQMKEQHEEEYENGYKADPRDCAAPPMVADVGPHYNNDQYTHNRFAQHV